MKSVSFKMGLQSESPCIGNQITQQKHLPLDIMMSQKQKKKRKRKKVLVFLVNFQSGQGNQFSPLCSRFNGSLSSWFCGLNDKISSHEAELHCQVETVEHVRLLNQCFSD